MSIEQNNTSNGTDSGDILGGSGEALDDITFDDDDSKPPYTDPSNIQNLAARSSAERLYNSIEDHLTPDDLHGAWRDLHGDPVPNPNTGGYYAHLGEVNDAMRSIRNAINTFADLLNSPDLSSSDRSIIEDLLRKGSKTLDYVEKIVSRDEWFPGTHISFP